MVELMAGLRLNDWALQNGVSNLEFKSFIGHKDNRSVYGAIFNSDKGLLFQRHKWEEVNKNVPPPRVCAEVKYSHKLVGEDIWNSFKELTHEEFLDRWAMDMKDA